MTIHGDRERRETLWFHLLALLSPCTVLANSPMKIPVCLLFFYLGQKEVKKDITKYGRSVLKTHSLNYKIVRLLFLPQNIEKMCFEPIGVLFRVLTKTTVTIQLMWIFIPRLSVSLQTWQHIWLPHISKSWGLHQNSKDCLHGWMADNITDITLPLVCFLSAVTTSNHVHVIYYFRMYLIIRIYLDWI